MVQKHFKFMFLLLYWREIFKFYFVDETDMPFVWRGAGSLRLVLDAGGSSNWGDLQASCRL